MLCVARKTPVAWATGVFFVVLFAAAQGACPPPGPLESATLDYVIDGDTLRLGDGRRVRLLGVDAPELGRDGAPDEPLARDARRAVIDFFAGDPAVLLAHDQRREDRFGRLLAHIYDSRERSLEARLLARGLAFQVVVPPSLAQAECFARREQRARQRQLGVWAEPALAPVAAGDLSPAHAGFRLVQGRIQEVTQTGDTLWLELDGPLVLRLSADDRRAYFAGEDWSAWRGKHLEVRGWIVDRSDSAAARRGFKPLMLPLRTPFAVRFLD